MFTRILALASCTALIGAAANHSPAPVTATKYTVAMTAAQETPPTGVAGTGTATLTLNGNIVAYVITVKGLSGPATAAHIHVGARGVAGGPVYTFMLTRKAADGQIARGTIDLTKPASAGVSGDSLKVLLNNGNAYINVHTQAHAAGEVRGQVVKK